MVRQTGDDRALRRDIYSDAQRVKACEPSIEKVAHGRIATLNGTPLICRQSTILSTSTDMVRPVPKMTIRASGVTLASAGAVQGSTQ